MATYNDYESGINSMSQEIFNSLKDSSGKIPSLANQLVMTEDEDGVVSQNNLYSHSFINSATSTRTATPSSGIITLVTITINKIEETSKILINWGCPIRDSSGGYGSFITLIVDGIETDRVLGNITSFYSQNAILKNLSTGSHTIQFCFGNGGNGSTSVGAYERPNGTIVEVL